MPSQSNEATAANAPTFRNPELYWVDLDAEEVEDLEKIQHEVKILWLQESTMFSKDMSGTGRPEVEGGGGGVEYEGR